MIWLRTLVQPLAERQTKKAGIEEMVRLVESEDSTLTTPQPVRQA